MNCPPLPALYLGANDHTIFIYFLIKLKLEFRGRKLRRPNLVAYPKDKAKVVGCGLPISLRASISILPYH